MTIKEKIQLYIDYKGITIYALEKKIGVSKSYWINTKNISADVLSNIILAYSDINLNWLFFDKGDMLNQDKGGETTEKKEDDYKSDFFNNKQSSVMNEESIRRYIHLLEKENEELKAENVKLKLENNAKKGRIA